MKTKAEYYTQMNEMKKLVGEQPTFKPVINHDKYYQTQADENVGGNRHDAILEKGK